MCLPSNVQGTLCLLRHLLGRRWEDYFQWYNSWVEYERRWFAKINLLVLDLTKEKCNHKSSSIFYIFIFWFNHTMSICDWSPCTSHSFEYWGHKFSFTEFTFSYKETCNTQAKISAWWGHIRHWNCYSEIHTESQKRSGHGVGMWLAVAGERHDLEAG